MSAPPTMEIDRRSIRARPPGKPLMYQTWSRLLFLHWSMPVSVLRPHVPAPLAIDTFAGDAWISVTPFTMDGIRLRFLPELPLASSSHEINVRTYVHHEGVPGVWFLSLDASNPLAVLGARLGFGLPYFQAVMSLECRDGSLRFRSRRVHPGARSAAFDATWRPGSSIVPASPDSLAFFLVERYCLYALRGGTLFRTRIHHEPWPLCRPDLIELDSTMVASHGLPTPRDEPLLHAQAAPLSVGVWAPSRVASSAGEPA